MRSMRLWWLGCLLVVWACGSRREAPHKPTEQPSPGQTLAQVGTHRITTQDMADRLNELPPSRRFQIGSKMDRKKVLLDELVEEELLVAEARRRGLHEEPRFRRMVRRYLANTLRAAAMEDVTLDSVTDKDVEAYYQANLKEFHIPMRIKARHILVASRALADRVAAEARRKGKTPEGFGKLAEKHSTDLGTKHRGGSLGRFSKPNPLVLPPLYQALQKLTKPGITGPIKSRKGWHILRLDGREEEKQLALEQVRSQLRATLLQKKRMERRGGLVEELRNKQSIQLFPEKLSSVKVDPPSKRQEPPRLGPRPPVGAKSGKPHGLKHEHKHEH